MTAEKVLENRLRRTAERRGYRLMKSRRRDPLALGYGGYMVQDVQTGGVVFGMSPREFSATLEEIEQYFGGATEQDHRPKKATAKAGRSRARTRKRP